jgi:nicotinic acid phosphoribosyltransferase
MTQKLAACGAPIDAFGAGTKLDTSEDAHYTECAYKFMEYDGNPRLKKSARKPLKAFSWSCGNYRLYQKSIRITSGTPA